MIFSITACHERDKSMSFYYWQDIFSLDSMERSTLQDNAIRQLYIRYFDVDWSGTDTTPVMTDLLRYQSSPADFTIIPVISLSNRIFERLMPAGIPAFAAAIFSQVRDINAQRRLQNREIQ